jgi:hypothetical protein
VITKVKSKENKNNSHRNNVRVSVKHNNNSLKAGDRLIIEGVGIHKVIPAVIFSHNEAQSILEIVEKVERDTFANIRYK